jgi:uncharacterized membrane protein
VKSRHHLLPAWRREALRTNLWVVPTVEVLGAVALFAVTYALDRAVYHGDLTLPGWVDNGTPDAGRQILIGIAAAVITVVGLVFSITIVALTLASTQFGPRMLRNFVRDRGTQVTLGTFVATFVYSVLTLGAISHERRGDFVPHLSITVALALVIVDLGVLIYFINHVAKSIQLPEVIASIARDLNRAIDAQLAGAAAATDHEDGPSATELVVRIEESGSVVPATRSGYLQFVGYEELVDLAASSGAVVQVLHRPGHFLVAGLPLAKVWPRDAAAEVGRALERAHVTGPQRTLAQDLAFAIDQLVEIAIRALSPAVNDTFSALTCIDWLGDALCRLSPTPETATVVHRDAAGSIRVIALDLGYDRLVARAFDKVRQAGRGMPAVMIRQLDALARIMEHTRTESQRDTLLEQAAMIERSSADSVPEPADRADVAARYELVVAAARARDRREPRLDPRPPSRLLP